MASLRKKYQALLTEINNAYLEKFEYLKEGEIFHLIEASEDEGFECEDYNDLPFVTDVDKHGYYAELRILSVTRKDNNLVINAHEYEVGEEEIILRNADISMWSQIDIIELTL